MSQQALTTIATRHQVFLERLKTQTAVDFSSVLPKISDAIAEVMSKLDVDSMDKLTRNQLRGLLIDLKLKQSELINKAQEKLVDDLKALNKYETDFEARTLEGALAAGGASKIALKVPAFPSSWKSTIQQPLSATGQLLEPFISGWGESQVAGVDAAVMKAWGEGRTVSQLMRDIRGTKSLNYQDGLVAVSRRQAEAIARTSIQHVAQQARMATWDENSDLIIGYTFVATLDGRTTSKCRSLDGMTFEMGKGPVPPVHVNCRSTTIPKLPKEFDFLDEGATRSSKDGYVAADQTYYGWLKTQPESFQDEVLGPSRAKLFREGGLTAEKFAALNMGKNFEPLSLAEMQLKEPQLFEKTGVVVRGATTPQTTTTTVFKDIEPDDFKTYAAVTGNQSELEYGDGRWEALSSYKSSGYKDINKYLRKDRDWDFEDPSPRGQAVSKERTDGRIAQLDRLMSESRLVDDVHLYRGFTPTKDFDFDSMQDFVFQDKGYVSSSTDMGMAEIFAREAAEETDNKAAIFRIRATKGQSAIAVESRLGYDSLNEGELLLPRGTTFRFTGNKDMTKKGITIYEVEIVSEE
jgi:SPP1 gp7 family putative phage head morphogenesis protein